MTEKTTKVEKAEDFLFEGGPSIKEINEWIETIDVWITEFEEGYTFFFRPINRIEFKHISSNPDVEVLEREEYLCQYGTVWPEKFDFANCPLGGIPSSLSDSIMAISGFQPTVPPVRAEELLAARDESE